MKSKPEEKRVLYAKQINYCVYLLKNKKGRGNHPEVSCKKGVLRNFTNFTGKHLRQSFFFNKDAGLRPKDCNFIKKETLALVFSCEFSQFSKNTFLHRTPLVAASEKEYYANLNAIDNVIFWKTELNQHCQRKVASEIEFT